MEGEPQGHYVPAFVGSDRPGCFRMAAPDRLSDNGRVTDETESRVSSELRAIAERLSRKLLDPLDAEGLTARHLSRLIARLLASYDAGVTEETAALRHRPLPWSRMKAAIQKETTETADGKEEGKTGTPRRKFAPDSFNAVPKDIKKRLQTFRDLAEEDFFQGRRFKFWFELESNGRQGARLILKREPVKGTDRRRGRVLRALLPTFQPRDAKYQQILDTFSGPLSSPSVCLFGPPTSGKTELAIYAAHQLEGFDGGVFFVSATNLDVREVLHRVLACLDVDAPGEADLSTLQHRYLQKGSEARALVVIDDLRKGLFVEDLRPPAGISLLITSRQRRDAGWLRSVEVGEFDDAESRAYLISNTSLTASQQAPSFIHSFAQSLGLAVDRSSGSFLIVDVVAMMCGRLPGVLAVAAETLHGIAAERADDYLIQLVKAPTRVRAVGWSHGSNAAEQALRSGFLELTSNAQLLMKRLSVFLEPFDVDEARAVFGAHQISLDELVAHGFLRWDSSVKRYHFNEFIRDFASLLLGECGEDADGWEPLISYLGETSKLLTTYYETLRRDGIDSFTQVKAGRLADRQRELKNTIARAALWLLHNERSKQRSSLPDLVLALGRWGLLPNQVFPERFDLLRLVEEAVAIARTTGDLAQLRTLLLVVPEMHPFEAATYAAEGLRLSRVRCPENYLSDLDHVIRHGWLPTSLPERIVLLEDKFREEVSPTQRIHDARRLARACTYAGDFARGKAVLMEALATLMDGKKHFPPKSYRTVLGTDLARVALHAGDAASAEARLSEIATLLTSGHSSRSTSTARGRSVRWARPHSMLSSPLQSVRKLWLSWEVTRQRQRRRSLRRWSSVTPSNLIAGRREVGWILDGPRAPWAMLQRLKVCCRKR